VDPETGEIVPTKPYRKKAEKKTAPATKLGNSSCKIATQNWINIEIGI
jgi:hypothetical protein